MSTTTTTRAEAVDAHGVVLTPEQRAQAVPVLDEHGKPKVMLRAGRCRPRRS